MTTHTSDALWYAAPGQVAIRPGAIVAGPDHVRVRAIFSGISRGTERLVLNGRVPPSEFARMRCPAQEGDFPFPVKYGYALVGEALDGVYRGAPVFLLHPHQAVAGARPAALHPLPAALPPRRACLTANMETALNVIWDAGVSAGDRITVIGAGVLGLLIAALAVRMPGTDVRVIDINPARGAIAARLGLRLAAPAQAEPEQDIVIHASGAPEGLMLAMALGGAEATVVEASWYGDKIVPLTLGGAFHAQRLKLISSQVGQLPPDRRPRWTYQRRLTTAMELLCDPVFDALITHEIAFADAPTGVPIALADDSDGLMTVLRYPA